VSLWTESRLRLHWLACLLLLLLSPPLLLSLDWVVHPGEVVLSQTLVEDGQGVVVWASVVEDVAAEGLPAVAGVVVVVAGAAEEEEEEGSRLKPRRRWTREWTTTSRTKSIGLSQGCKFR